MNNNKFKDLLLLILAIVFSVALMFAFIELPRWLNVFLGQNIGAPAFDQGSGESAAFRAEVFIDALYLRWIGYGSLLLVCFFIVMGFVSKKSTWAWAGAFVIFLPVFSQFAVSMFFLSGLGMLRTGWLPMMEAGFPILDLGRVIYVPYDVLMWFFGLFNWNARDFLSWFFMAIGSFLFAWGVFVWFRSRFGNKGVATLWIYKISRHPQYLGWIIWSYGLMIFSATENNMKKSWGDSTSFPWLVATMIIIAICMLEELSMRQKYGLEYDEYRKRTPFLFPIPQWLSRLFNAPLKLFTKSEFPQNKKQVAGITVTYTLIFMALSLFWVYPQIVKPERTVNPNTSAQIIDSLATVIYNTPERRDISKKFSEMGKYGDAAVDRLIMFLSDIDPVKREFAANQLGHIKSTKAVEPLIQAIHDENWRVRNSSANALAEIGDERAIGPIIDMIEEMPPNGRSRFYGTLGSLKAKEAWPFLAEDIYTSEWYVQNAILQAMADIDFENAKPYIYFALEDEEVRVRRQAVFIILEKLPLDAIDPVSRVLDDEDFEVRFYARQALNQIEKKKNGGI